MVERIRFEGVDGLVSVDLRDDHPGREFGRYSFIEHRAIVGFESDDRRSVSEIRSKVGQHMFGCDSCIKEGEIPVNMGY